MGFGKRLHARRLCDAWVSRTLAGSFMIWQSTPSWPLAPCWSSLALPDSVFDAIQPSLLIYRGREIAVIEEPEAFS